MMGLYKEDGKWTYHTDGCGCCTDYYHEEFNQEIPIEHVKDNLKQLKNTIAIFEQFLKEKNQAIEKPKLYVVGIVTAESYGICKICSTKESALKYWEIERQDLIKAVKDSLDDPNMEYVEMYKRMLKNLECGDADKIDNYPHETPVISEYELECE